ncbi:adenosylcobinamide-GDP ribazoletransferase [Candidatus Sumerlaeota bacterium]|nr:adenosylcobinamide-GDP ribazoletransferase [Candidatus Sumerlaeota bacterium]
MRQFLAALRFLTIVPVPGSLGRGEEDLAGSVSFFPLVGVLIGLFAAAVASVFGEILPQFPASVLTVIAFVAASGGLHLDGLSDTADAFFSARDRERMLRIMKDSHIGPMGVIAIVSVLLLKVAALASVPPEAMWRAAFLMPVAGRTALVVTMAVLPYARPEGGLGTPFYRKRPRGSALWAMVVLVVASWLMSQQWGLAAAGAAMVVVLVFAAYTYRKIGGATGDTLGAACEIAEVIPALAACVYV